MAMVGSILAARILGKSVFGELGMVRATILALGTFAGSGLGVAGTRYVAEMRDRDKPRVGGVINELVNITNITGVVMMIAALLLSPLIAIRLMNAPQLVWPVRIGAVLLYFILANGMQNGFIAGFENFSSLARAASLEALLNLILVPLGAVVSGLNGAIAGLVGAGGLSLIVRQNIVKREIRRSGIELAPRLGSQRVKNGLTAYLPYFLFGFTYYPFEWMAKLHLARQTGGFAELGLFNAAFSLSSVIIFLPNQLLAGVQAIMCNSLGKGDSQAFRRLSWFSILAAGGSSLLVALMMAVLSGPLMGMYGPGFTGGYRVLIMLAGGQVIYSLSLPSFKIMIATGRLWAQALFSALSGVSLYLMMLNSADRGAMGLSLAYLVSWLVLAMFPFVYIQRTALGLRQLASIGNGDAK